MDIDELVRHHYSRQRIGPERLESILRPRVRQPSRRRVALGLALAVAAGWMGATWLGNPYVLERDIDRVAGEIALNHRKQLSMEVASNDYVDIGARMSRLDFPLSRPNELAASSELIGARYCSIDGGLAVQLRLRESPAREAQTLFATRVTETLRALNRGQMSSDDVAIRYWVEGDVFFAHAVDRRTPTPPPLAPTSLEE